MRREQRKNTHQTSSNTFIYISGGILAVAVIAFIITFIVYSNRLNSNSPGILDPQYLSSSQENEIGNTASASSKVGKTVEEAENEIINAVSNEKNEIAEENTNKNSNKTVSAKSAVTSSKSDQTEKDPTFINPIDGKEIIKEFAKDNLVYSDTLKEWITHLGIDIKAEKATIVKSAADGTVKSIKNDPRYGLTIIIEHSNGYKTVYANLLTTEFVSEGEKVESGQTIGTVGDTGVYEIVDEPHLHFEIIKDNENINPCEVIKF